MPTFKTLAGAQKRAAFETAHSAYRYTIEQSGELYLVKRGAKKTAAPVSIDPAHGSHSAGCDWNATGATRLHDGNWYRNREHLPHLIRSLW